MSTVPVILEEKDVRGTTELLASLYQANDTLEILGLRTWPCVSWYAVVTCFVFVSGRK